MSLRSCFFVVLLVAGFLAAAFFASGLVTLTHGAERQYKKTGLNAMVAIVDGDCEKAVQLMQAFLENHPDDLESRYCLAVA